MIFALSLARPEWLVVILPSFQPHLCCRSLCLLLFILLSPTLLPIRCTLALIYRDSVCNCVVCVSDYDCVYKGVETLLVTGVRVYKWIEAVSHLQNYLGDCSQMQSQNSFNDRSWTMKSEAESDSKIFWLQEFELNSESESKP